MPTEHTATGTPSGNKPLSRQVLVALGSLLGSWAGFAALSLWLWYYNALLAGAVGVLLLFGGALWLPERTLIRHTVSVGFVLGFATASWYFLLR